MRAVPYPPEVPELFAAWHELKDRCDALARGNRELFDALDCDARLMTDRDGVVCEANAAAGRLLGIAQYRLRGKPLACFVALEERRAFLVRLLGLGVRGAEWRLCLRSRNAARREVETKVRAGERHFVWRLRERE